MEGWQERRTSFGSVAVDYAALRPGYPADAVDFLLGDQPRRVLDLGAGTGLLTDVLLAAGHEVVAVDLSGPMHDQLRARLPDGAVYAVVAVQAAHWFDPAPAAAELRRVLRPGGVVGLVWNTRDERVPWVRALGGLLAEEARDHEADQGVVHRFAAALPATVEVFDSGTVQRLTPEQVVAGIGTRSYVATMDDAGRARFLGRVRDLLATPPATRGREGIALPNTPRAYRLTP